MASDVQIANFGLRRLGANPILAFTDPTPEGVLVNDTYAEIRDTLLREHPWNFAIRRASLAASATAPVWGFDRAFAIPENFLRLLEVNGQRDYAVKAESIDGVGRVFVTDLDAPLEILYVARLTDPNLYDPTFRRALSLRCAQEWAEPLTATTSVLQAVAQEAAQALRIALGTDGQEGTSDVFAPNFFLDARA